MNQCSDKADVEQPRAPGLLKTGILYMYKDRLKIFTNKFVDNLKQIKTLVLLCFMGE